MTAAAAACEALLEIGGADVGQHEQPGGEAGTLAHLLTHSVSQCQFMFQTLQQPVRMVLYLGCKGQRAVTGALPIFILFRRNPSLNMGEFRVAKNVDPNWT